MSAPSQDWSQPARQAHAQTQSQQQQQQPPAQPFSDNRNEAWLVFSGGGGGGGGSGSGGAAAAAAANVHSSHGQHHHQQQFQAQYAQQYMQPAQLQYQQYAAYGTSAPAYPSGQFMIVGTAPVRSTGHGAGVGNASAPASGSASATSSASSSLMSVASSTDASAGARAPPPGFYAHSIAFGNGPAANTASVSASPFDHSSVPDSSRPQSNQNTSAGITGDYVDVGDPGLGFGLMQYDASFAPFQASLVSPMAFYDLSQQTWYGPATLAAGAGDVGLNGSGGAFGLSLANLGGAVGVTAEPAGAAGDASAAAGAAPDAVAGVAGGAGGSSTAGDASVKANGLSPHASDADAAAAAAFAAAGEGEGDSATAASGASADVSASGDADDAAATVVASEKKAGGEAPQGASTASPVGARGPKNGSVEAGKVSVVTEGLTAAVGPKVSTFWDEIDDDDDDDEYDEEDDALPASQAKPFSYASALMGPQAFKKNNAAAKQKQQHAKQQQQRQPQQQQQKQKQKQQKQQPQQQQQQQSSKGGSNNNKAAQKKGPPTSFAAAASASASASASNKKSGGKAGGGRRALTPSTVAELSAKVNPKEFDFKPGMAKGFVIKSFSEDDVHKSVKYGVWSSTQRGNSVLDAAYSEMKGRGPVYLFFNVNGSGRFSGMAKMMSRVNFNDSCSFWCKDGKWMGRFDVEWIFVKSVPNKVFRKVILPNNMNKPVTNSRDTTEILLPQLHEMLEKFATYDASSSIFDYFAKYDEEEIATRDRRNAKKFKPANGSDKSENASQASQEPPQKKSGWKNKKKFNKANTQSNGQNSSLTNDA